MRITIVRSLLLSSLLSLVQSNGVWEKVKAEDGLYYLSGHSVDSIGALPWKSQVWRQSESGQPVSMKEWEVERMLRFVKDFNSLGPMRETHGCRQTGGSTERYNPDLRIYACPVPTDLWETFADAGSHDLTREVMNPALLVDPGRRKIFRSMLKAFNTWFPDRDDDTGAVQHVKLDALTRYVVPYLTRMSSDDYNLPADKYKERKNEVKGNWMKIAAAARKLLGLDTERTLALVHAWQYDREYGDEFQELYDSIPPLNGMVVRTSIVKPAMLEKLVSFQKLTFKEVFTSPFNYDKSGKNPSIMATTLGLGGGDSALTFDGRGFLYIIYTRTGRLLPLVSSDAGMREVVLKEGLAGDFMVLGYKALRGLYDFKEGDVTPNYGAMFLLELPPKHDSSKDVTLPVGELEHESGVKAKPMKGGLMQSLEGDFNEAW